MSKQRARERALARHAVQPLPKPSVAIGVPSGDMVDADFCFSLASMMGHFHGNGGGRSILINRRGCYVDNNRNGCVEMAKICHATHLLFLDSDMIFPKETLNRLLTHEKDIVGCVYSRRVDPWTNLGTALDKERKGASDKDGLIEMEMIPTGVLLIRMNVFEKMPEPYFDRPRVPDHKEPMGEDVFFSHAARKAGFQLWADSALSFHIGHIGQAVYRVHEETKSLAAKIGVTSVRVGGEPIPQAAE